MKNRVPLLLLLLSTTALQAQTATNLVLNTPNAATPGQFNTVVGPTAGSAISTSGENVFVGNAAGLSTTSGSNNVFVGSRAGSSNSTGQGNTMLGFQAGKSSMNANANSFIGCFAGEQNTTGAGNTFMGYYAGNANTTGVSNVFIGTNTGQRNTTGIHNAFLGNAAGISNTTGGSNVFLGYSAGSDNTSGTFNVLVGQGAGLNLTTGYQNVMLGSSSRPTSETIHDAVAIGYNATVAINNAIVLGDVNNTSIAVGIGTDSPQFPLDVRGTINLRNNGRIKFAHLSNPVREGTTDQFLTVNEQGETVLAKYRLRINNTSEWSDKVFETGYKLKPLSEVGQYIQANKHLPGIPSAADVVENGIDPVRMDARLLEKIEELTLYSIQLEKSDQEQKIINQKQQVEIDELKRMVRQLLEKK